MAFFEMTKLALKWAMTKPATSQYPFTPRKPLAGSRGRLVFTKDNCVYCNVCAKKCPTGAITVQRAQKRWTLDRLRCINCGCCVEACPKDAIRMDTGTHAPAVLARPLAVFDKEALLTAISAGWALTVAVSVSDGPSQMISDRFCPSASSTSSKTALASG